MRRRALFLDLDGVLLDPERTHAEWIRLMGDVLAPALGGEPEDWGRANAEVFPRVFANRRRWADPDPLVTERRLLTHILQEECRFLGRPIVDDEVAVRLGREMEHYVCQRARCAYPATVDVIRTLARTHDVHMATGNPSWRVEPLLSQWGVRDRIGVPAGTDLVGVMKDTDAFYPAVFALADAGAKDATVVDDALDHLARAHLAGARTVWVAPPENTLTPAFVDVEIRSIAELPDALARSASRD